MSTRFPRQRSEFLGYCGQCGRNVVADYCDHCQQYVQPSPSDTTQEDTTQKDTMPLDTNDPDVPQLRIALRKLQRGVHRGEFTSREANAILGKMADALVAQRKTGVIQRWTPDGFRRVK